MKKYKGDSWNEYFTTRSKQIAEGTVQEKDKPLIYGKEIYVSPIIFSKEEGQEKQFYRWMVMDYQGEFNVFSEKIKKDGGVIRSYSATFNWKESAIKFALEMLLVCTGKMTRKGGIFH